MDEILRLRGEIDSLNVEILSCLSKRAALAEIIGREKERLGLGVRDPEREERQTAALLAGNRGPFSDDAIRKIFSVIYAESGRLQTPSGALSAAGRGALSVDCGRGVFVGGGSRILIAGPCSVEGEAQIMGIAERLSGSGVRMLRGGAFKPRTSPYSFQGLGKRALELLSRAAAAFGMACVSEATSEENVDMVAEYCDVVQIGARSMYNYPLLERAGRAGRPVLLKRHFSATIRELLLAAEYVLNAGNPNVILCERGIRTFETATRNTLDVSSIPILKLETRLPVIADVSHSAGRKDIAAPLAAAALAAGGDGIMVEVHPDPESALSDSRQQLTPSEFDAMVSAVRAFL